MVKNILHILYLYLFLVLYICFSVFPFLMQSFSLSSFVGSFARVGFSGSRHCGSAPAVSCRSFLAACSFGPGAVVGVGCARGVDLSVRVGLPAAQVFRVQPPASRSGWRAAFAARSARLVRWVASGGGLLVVFPLGPAPGRLQPSQRFAGFGSGSWGSAALALGLGCSVLVVLPAPCASAGFPAPAVVAGRFSRVGVAPCGGSLWLASPAGAPGSLPAHGAQLALALA